MAYSERVKVQISESKDNQVKLTFKVNHSSDSLDIPIDYVTPVMARMNNVQDLYNIYDKTYTEDGTILLYDTLSGVETEMFEDQEDDFLEIVSERINSPETNTLVDSCTNLIDKLYNHNTSSGLYLPLSAIKSYFTNGYAEDNEECIERGFKKIGEFIMDSENEGFSYQHGMLKMIKQIKGYDKEVDKRLAAIASYVEGDRVE